MCLTEMHSMQHMMTSEDGSNSVKNGFCWIDGGEKSEKFVSMQSEILLVAVWQSHHNDIGGINL